MTQAGALDEALRLAQAEDACWQASPDWHFTLGVLFMECARRDEANLLHLGGFGPGVNSSYAPYQGNGDIIDRIEGGR